MLHSRMDRVGKLLQEEIAQIIDRELKNPNLPEFITVSHVKVSRDLSEAVVAITFLQDTAQDVIDRTVKELNKAAGFIRTQVARRVEIRKHPHLKFVYNPSTRYALEIEKLFHQIKSEEPAKPENTPEVSEESTDEKE